MKNIITQYSLPACIVLFTIFSQWHYVYVEDGANEFMYGFPLIYNCNAFHTSLAQQYFIMEMLIDIGVYFIITTSLLYLFHRFVFSFKKNKWISRVLYIVAFIFINFFIIFNITFSDDNRYYLKRDFNIHHKASGFQFIWQKIDKNKIIEESNQSD